MKIFDINHSIEILHQQVFELQHYVAEYPVPSDSVLIDIQTKLQNSLTEIRTVGEELQRKNEELTTVNKVLQQDIANYKKSERKAKRYEFIANTSLEFMTLIDSDYTYQAVNNAYCRAHNKPRHESDGAVQT